MVLDRSKISCAVIRTDLVRKNSTYEEDGSAHTYGRTFNVDPMEIVSIMKAIKTTCEEEEMPISRMYISGFSLVYPDDVWSEEKVVDYFKKDLETIKKFEQGSAYVKKINL